jgi:glycine/D-amino acid oxidase-like deaminating enzyme
VRRANALSRYCATVHRPCSISRGAIRFRPSRNNRGGCSRCIRQGRIKIAERRVRQWSKLGAPVELLSREQTRQMLGSDAWFGGFWNREWRPHQSARAVAPSCARGAGERGGRIYARSPAIGFERDNGRWVVKTEKGEINVRALIAATNAYTGEFSKTLMPAIAHEVMPVLSWQMTTQPLPETARQTIIPGRQAMSDTHGELYFARYDARNRLVTGGARSARATRPNGSRPLSPTASSGCGRRSASSNSITSGTAMSE